MAGFDTTGTPGRAPPKLGIGKAGGGGPRTITADGAKPGTGGAKFGIPIPGVVGMNPAFGVVPPWPPRGEIGPGPGIFGGASLGGKNAPGFGAKPTGTIACTPLSIPLVKGGLVVPKGLPLWPLAAPCPVKAWLVFPCAKLFLPGASVDFALVSVNLFRSPEFGGRAVCVGPELLDSPDPL